MSKYYISVELVGDPGQVEFVIDEIVSSISFMDLEHVGIEIKGAEVIGSD